MPRPWDEFSERLRDLETRETAPDIISPFLALPGLRAFWPMSAISEAFPGNAPAVDLSGNGRTLTYIGALTYNYDGLVPYADFNGAGDRLDRADEAGLDILGTEFYVAAGARGLTFGGWFYADAAGAGGVRFLMQKTNPVANSAYSLELTAANELEGYVAAVLGYFTPGIAITHGEWFFAALRYTPSTEVKIWHNETTAANTTGIPAAINNSPDPFSIGGRAAAPSNYFDGRASCCFLCTMQLDDSIVASLFDRTRGAFGV